MTEATTEVVKASEVPGAHSVWDALRSSSPEIAEASNRAITRSNAPRYDDYAGFKPWLLSEFALATPTRVLAVQLEHIRADMIADGAQNPWPHMNSRQLLVARRDLEPHWRPLRSSLESRVHDIGVVNKNRRLLALQQMAENIEAEMYSERDEKSGRLYLLPEYRDTLRAIAEEVGELGMQVDERDNTIRGLVEILSKAMDISGMGVQTVGHDTAENTGAAPYDYRRAVVDAEFAVNDEALNA